MADSHEARPVRFADAVIVAAGASRRMGGADKLSENLAGRTVLEWSIDAMRRATTVNRVVVVVRADRVSELARSAATSGVEVVAGGDERSDSVRHGVAATSAEVVLVHDAARPLASPALADAVAHAAAEHGAAIPVLPVVDSLKRAAGEKVIESVDRTGLFRSQTPQGARRVLLVDSLATASGRSFTDEASLLEAAGVTVVTVPGEATNVKLTEPRDLELARALVRGSDDRRIGFGQDSHGFGPDDGLWLGGVFMERSPRLYGHSDGDVVLHALATAVLSACGLGDIGRLFPAGRRETKGIASAELLAEATRHAAAAGWTVESVQVSLVGARPRLGAGLIDRMRARVAELLGLSSDAVSLTASSGNLSGPEGAGRVISATALVSAHRR